MPGRSYHTGEVSPEHQDKIQAKDVFVDDLSMFMDFDIGHSLDLVEGGVGRHSPPPVKFEYPTCSSEGKVLCQTRPPALGLNSTDG